MQFVRCFIVFTQLRSILVSAVFDFNTSLNSTIPVSPILLPVGLIRMEYNELSMDVICVLFLLCSLHRMTPMSVVFDFNASLNDVAPISPILLPVDLMRIEKSGLLMDAICVLSLCVLPPSLSFASVVFDFNASLNDVAPVSPMLLAVVLMRTEELIVDGCHLYCFHCAHYSN